MLKTKNKENTFNACPVEAGNALRLREPMPVMDQLNSPWCATFTAAYQLKHYARQNGVKLPLNLNLSVLDLNQKTDDSEHGIPGHFMITNGAKIIQNLILMRFKFPPLDGVVNPFRLAIPKVKKNLLMP